METKTKKVLTPVVDENKKITFTIEKEDKTNNEKLVNEKNSINSNEKSIKQSAKEFFNSEIGKLIKIVFVIACVILVFLLITNVINNIKKDKKDPVTNGTIQYDEILVSNLLTQQNNTYYVLVYDSKDLYFNAYNTYITAYKGSENAQRFYTAVLSNGFNKKYYSEKDSNVVGANIDNLKFKDTTLVKVENGAIVASYEDSTSILNFLKSL